MNSKILFILGGIVVVALAAYFLLNGSSTGSYGNPFSQNQVSSNPSNELNQLDNSDSDLNGMDSDLNSLDTETSGL